MDDKYKELREAAEKATPGPWRWIGAPGGWDAVADEGNAVICQLHLNHPDNAGYIAAANPAAIQALLAERDALRGALQAAVDCGMVPKSSASEGGANKHSEQVRVADQIRAMIQHQPRPAS